MDYSDILCLNAYNPRFFVGDKLMGEIQNILLGFIARAKKVFFLQE